MAAVKSLQRRARVMQALGVATTVLGLLLLLFSPSVTEVIGGGPAAAVRPLLVLSVAQTSSLLVIFAGLVLLALGAGYSRGTCSATTPA